MTLPDRSKAERSLDAQNAILRQALVLRDLAFKNGSPRPTEERGASSQAGQRQGRRCADQSRAAEGTSLMGTSGPRRWRVWCSQWASCRWSGYRTGDTREEALGSKPCPRCGHRVVA